MTQQKRKPFEAYACFIILAVMTAVMFAGVVWRYVFNSSLVWSEELTRYLFIWFVFLSASYAVTTKSHIRVDALNMMIPVKIRKYVNLIGSIVWVGFSFFIAYLGVEYALNLLDQNTISAAIKAPMGIVYLGIPIGYSLMGIRIFIHEVYAVIFNKEAGDA
ncbi:MAG TPA: TRAP transporter small permease [Metalysinibacillus sp.]